MDEPKIGIFGGSGFYSMFEKKIEKKVDTSYTKPSAPISLGTLEGKTVAFMPRHGRKHSFPPHKIPYKSNVNAFKEMGVERVLAPNAAGSLQKEIKPGDFVICDQLVNMTWGREDTYFNGPEVAHLGFAEPYCPELRKICIEACKKLDVPHHTKGTVVVINGPRFSTMAESDWFTDQGWHVINMTQYPEAVLAREKDMCYANISLITDYDAGLTEHEHIKPVTADEVVRIFKQNNETVKKVLAEIVKNLPAERSCECVTAMESAKL